jgi:hypothetical protein
MKKIYSFILSAIVVAAGPAQAFEPVVEPVASVYFNMPLSKSQTQKPALTSYGFRLQAGQVMPAQAIELSRASARKPWVDLQYNRTGLSGFYVNGINALEVQTSYNASTGGTSTVKTINWGLVGLGVITAVVLFDGKCKTSVRYAFTEDVMHVGAPVCGAGPV